jgi:hypothetical protein
MVILFSMEHEKLYYLAMVCNEDWRVVFQTGLLYVVSCESFAIIP